MLRFNLGRSFQYYKLTHFRTYFISHLADFIQFRGDLILPYSVKNVLIERRIRGIVLGGWQLLM